MWAIYEMLFHTSGRNKTNMAPAGFLESLSLGVLARRRLSVFVFHKVPEQPSAIDPHDLDLSTFKQMLDFIETRFKVLPLADAIRSLKVGTLPGSSACITFDDGYSDWATGILPELARRNLHATFYIAAGQLGGTPLWHERVAHALSRPALLRFDQPGLPPLCLNTLQDRQQARISLENFLKYQPLNVRDAFIERLEAEAGVVPGALPRLSVETLRNIHNAGLEVGAHTVNHPILTANEPATARREIGEAREILAHCIGGPVTAFAYPNGRPGSDFSAEHIRMVRQAGFTSAVSSQFGAADVHTSEFQIPRFTPWGPGVLRMSLQLGRNLLARLRYLEEHQD